MPAPQFTDAERAVLNHLNKSSWLDNLAFDAGYLSAAGMFFLVGILSESLGPVILGMASILAIKTWEWTHQRRSLPLLKSALQKYEQMRTADAFQPDSSANSDSAVPETEDLRKLHLTIRAMLVNHVRHGRFLCRVGRQRSSPSDTVGRSAGLYL